MHQVLTLVKLTDGPVDFGRAVLRNGPPTCNADHTVLMKRHPKLYEPLFLR